jgi:hypothetical protein
MAARKKGGLNNIQIDWKTPFLFSSRPDQFLLSYILRIARARLLRSPFFPSRVCLFQANLTGGKNRHFVLWQNKLAFMLPKCRKVERSIVNFK